MHLLHAEQYLLKMFKTRQAIELRSSPGVGKSSVVEQVAAKLSSRQYLDQPVACMTFMLATIEPPDVRGYMIPTKRTNEETGAVEYHSTFSLPPLIPTPGVFANSRSAYKVYKDGELVEDGHDGVPDHGIVFLDERAQAAHDVQKPAADFMLNKRVGQHALPDGWTVWAASNRTSDKSGVNRDLAFLTNRMCVIEIDAHLDSWVNWAERRGVHPMAIAFAKHKPGLIFEGTVPDKPGPFATPRSLVFAIEALQALSPDPDAMELPTDGLSVEAASGWMGDGAASEFLSFMRIAGDLPSFDDIVDDPEGTPVPTRPDVVLALSQMIAHRTDESSAGPVFKFVNRLPREFQVATLQSTLRKCPSVIVNEDFSAWLQKNKELVLAANAVRS